MKDLDLIKPETRYKCCQHCKMPGGCDDYAAAFGHIFPCPNCPRGQKPKDPIK